MTERERLIKATYFRSQHRGGREADVIIGGFTQAQAHLLNDENLSALANLLCYDDHEILYWIECPDMAPTTISTTLLILMNDYAYHILATIDQNHII